MLLPIIDIWELLSSVWRAFDSTFHTLSHKVSGSSFNRFQENIAIRAFDISRLERRIVDSQSKRNTFRPLDPAILSPSVPAIHRNVFNERIDGFRWF